MPALRKRMRRTIDGRVIVVEEEERQTYEDVQAEKAAELRKRFKKQAEVGGYILTQARQRRIAEERIEAALEAGHRRVRAEPVKLKRKTKQKNKTTAIEVINLRAVAKPDVRKALLTTLPARKMAPTGAKKRTGKHNPEYTDAEWHYVKETRTYELGMGAKAEKELEAEELAKQRELDLEQKELFEEQRINDEYQMYLLNEAVRRATRTERKKHPVPYPVRKRTTLTGMTLPMGVIKPTVDEGQKDTYDLVWGPTTEDTYGLVWGTPTATIVKRKPKKPAKKAASVGSKYQPSEKVEYRPIAVKHKAIPRAGMGRFAKTQNLWEKKWPAFYAEIRGRRERGEINQQTYARYIRQYRAKHPELEEIPTGEAPSYEVQIYVLAHDNTMDEDFYNTVHWRHRSKFRYSEAELFELALEYVIRQIKKARGGNTNLTVKRMQVIRAYNEWSNVRVWETSARF